jgi:hypothetical protein
MTRFNVPAEERGLPAPSATYAGQTGQDDHRASRYGFGQSRDAKAQVMEWSGKTRRCFEGVVAVVLRVVAVSRKRRNQTLVAASKLSGLTRRLVMTRIVIVVLAVVCAWGGLARAGAPANPWWGDIIVVTVVGVSAPPHTNGNPPRVTVRVEEVLQGDAKLDRTSVEWGGHFHDVDWGVPERNPIVLQWKLQGVEPPKVGEQWIVAGWVYGSGAAQALITTADGRTPFTAQRWAETVAMVKKRREEAAQYAVKQAAEAAALAKAIAGWRAGVTNADLARYAAEADCIVLVTDAHGGRDGYSSKVESFLKGAARRDLGWVTARLPAPVDAFLADREQRYLLFLTESRVEVEPSAMVYWPIKSGDGVVIADATAMEAVKTAVGKGGATTRPARAAVYVSMVAPINVPRDDPWGPAREVLLAAAEKARSPAQALLEGRITRNLDVAIREARETLIGVRRVVHIEATGPAAAGGALTLRGTVVDVSAGEDKTVYEVTLPPSDSNDFAGAAARLFERARGDQ